MRKHYYQRLATLVKLYLTCIYIFIITSPTDQMHYFSKDDCTDDVQDLHLCGNVTSSAFYYNFITKTCEQVPYRGCSPTRNHFNTLEECNTLALDICFAIKVFGKEDCHEVPPPCSVGIPRGFQFDVDRQRCRPVVMGDCSRTMNYFKTERDCRRITRLVCYSSTEDVNKVTEVVPHTATYPAHHISTENENSVDGVTETIPNYVVCPKDPKDSNEAKYPDYPEDGEDSCIKVHLRHLNKIVLVMRKHYYQYLKTLVKLYQTCIYVLITTIPTEQMHYFSEEDCTDDVQDLDLCGNVTSSAFHYNFITKTCEQVPYRGCSPTRNHFNTLEECNTLALSICSAIKVFGKEDCHQVPQPCSIGIPRGFQFDVGRQRCQPVAMGDCSRSTNYFKTKRDCRRITRLVCCCSTNNANKVTATVPLKTDSPKYSSGLSRTTHSLNGDLDKVTKTVVIATSTPRHVGWLVLSSPSDSQYLDTSIFRDV